MKNNENYKFLLKDSELITLRKEIFKNRDSNHRVLIPNEFMEYLDTLDGTHRFKANILVAYIGIILTYREAYYTYRKHHINLEVICQVMGIRFSDELRKVFQKGEYLEKNHFIGYERDFPISYNFSYKENEGKREYFIRYNMASELSDEVAKDTIYDYASRQLRSINPIRHTKGITRKRGRGVQVIAPPIDVKADKYISINYETIRDFINNELSLNTFFYIAKLKKLICNKIVKTKTEFRTSRKRLAAYMNISIKTFEKSHIELKKYTKGKYELVQIAKADKDGGLKSSVFLKLECQL
ncbi:hypothetical protein ACFDHY_06925 [Staphylococcus hyicus]|uniref:hypothetical protein n=1 Tax=Staphylococcus hyicus TaxID=1284 RepID=UPI00211BD286|nr:hypothetical protein [Staphylococcus hyicus]MCQ9301365.1 hypothetical protein [Staphylococcus hyicus]MDP4448351.1 hypothetical protein [Staphylococcus hyicus]MDP4459732.1 hypothetical protein [Staphylococcus hyicus]